MHAARARFVLILFAFAQASLAQVRDAALPPADIATIQSIIDKDMTSTLASGELGPKTGVGVTIGMVLHGKRTIWTYGATRNDSVYEIGSITKTFTATMLAQMVKQNAVRLDTPVRELLPQGAVAKPDGPEITLLDLSTHHAGFPHMPTNLHPNGHNPLTNYTSADLLAYMKVHGVAMPANPQFLYSNFGVGLLGYALANREQTSYGLLLRREVLDPLRLMETGVSETLPPAVEARVVQAHHANGTLAEPAEVSSLEGCGAIHSTAADMLTYLSAELHPDALPTTGSAEAATLPAAIAATHVPRASTGTNGQIALNWFVAGKGFNHTGATPGFSAFVAFNPSEDWAVVVLSNIAPGERHLTGTLGPHIIARIAGRPAASLTR